jgi:mycothiol synthase
LRKEHKLEPDIRHSADAKPQLERSKCGQENSNMQIRAFTENDYETVANIEKVVNPDLADTAEEIRYYDGVREKHLLFKRFLAEDKSGNVFGVGVFRQTADRYHPNKFYLDINVLPEHRHQGGGRGLLEHLLTKLEDHQVITVRGMTRADWTHSIRFLEAAGFSEEYRAWESRLDVQSFDASPYLHLEEKLKCDGIELKSYADLVGTPDLMRELWRLDLDAGRDMPDPEPFVETSFERFETRTLNNPDFAPEAYVVAVKPGNDQKLEFLALSTLWWSEGKLDAWNGATGTRREWRGKKIALALKVKNILWAKNQGIAQIKTFNDDVNRPMLAINKKLGFVKQPAWVHFVRHFERKP